MFKTRAIVIDFLGDQERYPCHHGYRIGPGTLYPLLHGLERGGLLKSVLNNVGGHSRRVYKITSAGKKALDKARVKVDELHHELHEEKPRVIANLAKRV